MKKLLTSTLLMSTLFTTGTGVGLNLAHADEKSDESTKYIIDDDKTTKEDTSKESSKSDDSKSKEEPSTEMATPPENPDHSHDHDGYHDNTPVDEKDNSSKSDDTKSKDNSSTEMATPSKNPDHSHDHDGYHDNTPVDEKSNASNSSNDQSKTYNVTTTNPTNKDVNTNVSSNTTITDNGGTITQAKSTNNKYLPETGIEQDYSGLVLGFSLVALGTAAILYTSSRREN